MRKGCGIVLLVFGVGNLLVAFLAASTDAPADVIGSKFSAALLLGVTGALVLYFGGKKDNDQ